MLESPVSIAIRRTTGVNMIAALVLITLTLAGVLDSRQVLVVSVVAWIAGYATLLVHFWTTRSLTPDEKSAWRRRLFSWSPLPDGLFQYLFARDLGAQARISSGNVEHIYNYRVVDESLATSGQPKEEQLLFAARDGFQVVINLALHGDARYSLKDERASVTSLGMHYVHIPVEFHSPTESDLQQFFAAMDEHRGKKILVHCAANKRVTAFVGMYQTLKLGWPVEKAFALMHTVWQPDPIWAAFISERVAFYKESVVLISSSPVKNGGNR